MEKDVVADTAKILRVLGDKTRLSMLKLLELKDCCVCEFVEIFHMSQPAISQHIKRLKDANLVNERRSGQWIIYSLNQDNENYFLLQDVLHHLPSQEDKLNWLEQQGFAIICE
ncbi:MAG TPA: metalloregulator ArsR/SmtB family transcription factor [Pseudogracilibacillus sp.]|nr:metalloregulator ArsR/SmtB family transcription factor [Pseudogracilibacillus sp.]